MNILPISSLYALFTKHALFTKVVNVIETTALEQSQQRHILHYAVKGLSSLPTSIIDRLNHYLNAPTAEQFPQTDAAMRLLLALNNKLRPPVKLSQLLQLRQKFAIEMVALQSPSVWQQTKSDNYFKTTMIMDKVCKIKNSNNEENANAVGWQDKIIANADGGDMTIRCYHPIDANEQNGNGQNPDNVVMLFFHGGGFCLGDVNTHHEFCYTVCAQTNWALVSIDYRLAPEHPAPTAIRDCLKAYAWLAQHADTLGASSSRIVLAGDSSGGGLAALVAQQVSNAVMMHATNQKPEMPVLDDFTMDIFQQLKALPLPLAQLLLYPITDIDTDYPSWKLYGQGLILNYNDVQVFHEAYLQDCSLLQPHALLSPMAGDNTHLCPSYIVAAELDILHDEVLVYAEQLRGYGINVQTYTVLGAPHGFINLMSVHQGMGYETHYIIDAFATFVRQLIKVNVPALKLL